MIVLALVAAPALALVLNLTLTPLIVRTAHRRRWFDAIDDRKIHTRATPRLGGVGFALASILAASAGLVAAPVLLEQVRGPLLILSGLVGIHILGLVDDFRNLHAAVKFAGQLLFALLIAIGAPMESVELGQSAVHVGPAAIPLTVVWLVGLGNAVNLLDGMDGLAGGTSAIASLVFGMISLASGDPASAIWGFCLFAALVGFLVFNLPRARIFMGDSGSLFLGYALGVLPLLRTGASSQAPLLLLLVLLPVLDTLFAIIRRVAAGKPIHQPDRAHFHHRLLDRGMSTWGVLGVAYGLDALLGIAAFAVLVLEGGAAVGSYLAGVLVAAAVVLWVTRPVEDGPQSDPSSPNP